jgi:hypothetical protein
MRAKALEIEAQAWSTLGTDDAAVLSAARAKIMSMLDKLRRTMRNWAAGQWEPVSS